MSYVQFLSFFVWKSIMSAPKCQKIPHLLTLLFVCSGLSPRDLILHFRHKVENTNWAKTLMSGFITTSVIPVMSPSQVLILFKLILLEKKVREAFSAFNVWKVTLNFLFLMIWFVLFAGALLRVSCQQTSRSSDDSFITVPRSETPKHIKK